MRYRPIPILAPGRYRASDGSEVEFSASDLQEAADAYDPSVHEAPLVLGHPADDAPAYGWVGELRWNGHRLWAVPSTVSRELVEWVRRGKYRKVSASLYRPDAPTNPVPGVWYLRHVGFLGAQPPAVKGLPPAQLGSADAGVVFIEGLEQEAPGIIEKLREMLVGLQEREDWRVGGDRNLRLLDDDEWDGDVARDEMVRLAGGDPDSEDFDWSILRRGHVIYNAADPRKLGSYKFPFAKVVDGDLRASRRGLIAVLQRAPRAQPAALRDRIAAFARSYLEEAQMQEELDRIKQERDELRKQLEEIKARQARAAAESVVAALVREGRVLAAEAPALTELLILADSSTVQLGEGQQKQGLRAWLESWLRSLPQRVPTGRLPDGTEPEPVRFAAPPGYAVDRDRLALLAEAQRLAASKQIDLVNAVRLIEAR